MMDYNLSVFGEIVETVRPLLHHAAALGEVLQKLPEPIFQCYASQPQGSG
jgi:hypothetical protein